MPAVKSDTEIKHRIRETEQQLVLIEKAMAREMSRPFFKRRIGVCRFLDIEKKLFSAKLNELKWVMYEK
jgi:hypothetical protein